MKLVRSLTLTALGLGTLGVAISVGCGGTTSNNSGDSGTKSDSPAGEDSGGGMSIVVPPSMGSKTTQTTAQNFAIHQLYLGDTDYGGTAGGDPMAWATMGYNIDGKITTATSTNVCTLQGMATTAVQVDGNGGIDNSFGNNIFNGILLGVDTSASSTILTDVAAGDFTLMFDVVGLDSTSTQTATGLSGQAFAGGKFNAAGTAPTWTPSDNWPVLGGSLLSSTSPITSTIQFPDAYVVNGTWVSGSPADIPLAISIDGINITLTISRAVITFEHASANHAAKGVVAGIIATSDLTAAIGGVAGFLGLCGGEVSSITDEIAAASDIVTVGNNNAGTPCDGISIGLGFQADVIGQPMMVAPPGCPKQNMCDTDAAAPDCGAD